MGKGKLIALSASLVMGLTGSMLAYADTTQPAAGQNATAPSATQPAATPDNSTSMQSPQAKCSGANGCSGKSKPGQSSDSGMQAPPVAQSPINSQD